MLSDFDTEEKIVMFPQATLDAIAGFIALHGSDLPSKPKDPTSTPIRTICGRLDREGSNDLRPCEFPENTSPTALTNGQFAYKAYWTNSVITTIEAGSPNASFLTQSELDNLTPPPTNDF